MTACRSSCRLRPMSAGLPTSSPIRAICWCPFPAELMMMWPISTRVNKPDNDDPTILDPLEPVEGGSPTLL